MVYEYLYRQINDKKVRETIDFLLNREEAHNQMFRDAFNQVQNSGSNQDFGTTKAATIRFLTPRTSPFAFDPSAATTLIALIPRFRSSANTFSRDAAFIESSCRTPSEVLYA